MAIAIINGDMARIRDAGPDDLMVEYDADTGEVEMYLEDETDPGFSITYEGAETLHEVLGVFLSRRSDFDGIMERAGL
jgi:hypothetical protein